ncbi:MAG: acyl-CoA dehydrogenase family protein [Acidimicrobiales bacterium]
MDFDLSEDQLALRKAAATLLDAMAPTTRVRTVADGDASMDRELWAAMAEQGWPAVETPEDAGGLGLGMVEVAVLCEELGRHVAPVPFLSTVLVQGSLRNAAAAAAVDAGVDAAVLGDATVAEWRERLAGGDAIGAVAWSSRDGAVTAVPAGDGWRLSGKTDPTVCAPLADVAVTCAQTPDGLALFALVPADRPAALPAMDRTRPVGVFEWRDQPAVRIGGSEALDAVVDRAAAGLSAEMLGAADNVLAMAVQYAKDRVQFGRPIGSFQAVKHRCADMLVDVEGMRSAAYYAAWSVGAGEPDASAASSAAKIWCTDASRRVMGSALQVHGGIGFTWEHDLHLFLKRAQLDQVSYGDARYHRDRLAGILRPKAEAGAPVL